MVVGKPYKSQNSTLEIIITAITLGPTVYAFIVFEVEANEANEQIHDKESEIKHYISIGALVFSLEFGYLLLAELA
ncbi:17772_t:CDS:2 [Entrophospora sp. SA101]|nr:10931_t:CDS:2 [Entrophospora sp. SA101]CAJ0646426.1 15590_t:CDS:2 [Entrophospora sp. SA101]CAJ0646428.1 15592_t:CDS:2 [Entrophospora sp. SA101]CAJ0769299.1 17772_t:CDS:2 [Entrophospora sp. SA101]CAJ0856135.1 12074_t:CDS:2 [Entrophospora sp. SA101]